MTRPHKHQKKGIRKLIYLGLRALLADEMGLGKTFQILRAAQITKSYPVLVICPATLRANWQDEIRKHLHMRSKVIDEPPTKPIRKFIRRRLHRKGIKFLIINYERLKQWHKYLLSHKFNLIVIDEGHYLQNPRALRTRYTYKLCAEQSKIVVLTGTPITNYPITLWSIAHLLWPGEFTDFQEFAWNYCSPKRTPWGWKYDGAENLEELHQRLKHCGMIRRRKADVLKGLPKKARFVVPLQLTNRSEYDRAENHFIAWLVSIGHTGRLVGALKAERLVQMGYLKRLAAWLKMNAVIEWIDNFLAEGTGKLLVFAIHKRIIKKLSNKYKDIAVVIDGSKTKRQRRKAEKRFQHTTKIRLLIGNIRAAGVGLNLTAADTVAFIELPWKPADCEQAEDRCYGRLNDLHGASIYYLVAHHTLEDKLCSIIQRKHGIATTAIDGGKRRDHLNVHDLLTAALMKKR
jgi:SWI/SNF-related matrix-associated actin-dependent regulator 1 of chromatin subfamily A